MLIAGSFTVGCVSDAENPEKPLAKLEKKNVAYGEHQHQKYDIYLPKGRTEEHTKVLVLVHGGGWVEGDKNEMNGFIAPLQNNFPDHAIVNINYRLASEGNSPFPMQLDDIKSVLTHLQQPENEYNISKAYGLIGVSAGGHLSLLTAYQHNPKNEIKAVCSIVGPTNFTDPAYVHPTELGYLAIKLSLENITGESMAGNPEYFKDKSPYHVVTAPAPPTILFYGDSDPLVPNSQGVKMAEKLDQLGVTNEFTLYQGAAHGWEGQQLDDTVNKLKAFITQNF